jgi:Sigma-70, region 4
VIGAVRRQPLPDAPIHAISEELIIGAGDLHPLMVIDPTSYTIAVSQAKARAHGRLRCELSRDLAATGNLRPPAAAACAKRTRGKTAEWPWAIETQSVYQAQGTGEGLTVLKNRERRIFEARLLSDEPFTLEELAEEFGVSRERVGQIEVRAFEKMQNPAPRCDGAAGKAGGILGTNSHFASQPRYRDLKGMWMLTANLMAPLGSRY